MNVVVNIGGSALFLSNLGELKFSIGLRCVCTVLLVHHGCIGMCTSAI